MPIPNRPVEVVVVVFSVFDVSSMPVF